MAKSPSLPNMEESITTFTSFAMSIIFSLDMNSSTPDIVATKKQSYDRLT
ncbi:hypothetical protein [Halobacillus amylolyticus]|uniref:Uncharacterized protein n=1 Tax=Halobacillus amylolyticus TaxID=2932259 RepID=A0ABY4HA93_9BACI|nr:hypothetical protein [Halobacillus amylolyticus]UOR11367.1 hypothetical protein MUO15_17485 [Halobacillus amylolyticus]